MIIWILFLPIMLVEAAMLVVCTIFGVATMHLFPWLTTRASSRAEMYKGLPADTVKALERESAIFKTVGFILMALVLFGWYCDATKTDPSPTTTSRASPAPTSYERTLANIKKQQQFADTIFAVFIGSIVLVLAAKAVVHLNQTAEEKKAVAQQRNQAAEEKKAIAQQQRNQAANPWASLLLKIVLLMLGFAAFINWLDKVCRPS